MRLVPALLRGNQAGVEDRVPASTIDDVIDSAPVPLCRRGSVLFASEQAEPSIHMAEVREPNVWKGTFQPPPQISSLSKLGLHLVQAHSRNVQASGPIDLGPPDVQVVDPSSRAELLDRSEATASEAASEVMT